MSENISVEVVYAEAQRQWVVQLELSPESTIAEALMAARPRLPKHLDLNTHDVGVFGERCAPEEKLRDQDRVEIYRPLLRDAKSARRLRAEKQAQQKR